MRASRDPRTPARHDNLGRCLVTGGAGFIGSNLVEALMAGAATVRVFDSFVTGIRENLDGLDVEVVEGDLADPGAVRAATEGVDTVFHLGALNSATRSFVDPAATYAANATGTVNVLLAARERCVARLVYASSSSVYGPVDELPMVESMPTRPISPYGASKLAGESSVIAFHRSFGVPGVALRFFNVYGPRQRPDSEYAAVVPRFMTAALSGRPLRVFGDGEQIRDFTYVDDIVAANLAAAAAPVQSLGRAFNISGGQPCTVNEFAKAVVEAVATAGGTAPAAPVEHTIPRAGDVRDSIADPTAARSILSYEPMVGLEEGIRRTLVWFREREGATSADVTPGSNLSGA